MKTVITVAINAKLLYTTFAIDDIIVYWYGLLMVKKTFKFLRYNGGYNMILRGSYIF